MNAIPMIGVFLLPQETTMNEDPYMWLEEVEGEKPLNWVRGENEKTVATYAQSESFSTMKDRLLKSYDSKDKITYFEKIGDHYYNFWRDQNHVKGVWRRTTEDQITQKEPNWETVLDLDALAKEEDVSWVWRGSTELYPDYKRTLISLSRGGADATVVREFDLEKKKFIEGGFSLPESKGGASWVDENTIIIGRDFGEGTTTDSGYPAEARILKRGQSIEQAKTVFKGEKTDVSAGGFHSRLKGFERTIYYRNPSFYTSERYLVIDGKAIKIDKPDDADLRIFREWMTIDLKSDWKIGDKTYKQGSVLITKLNDFMEGKRDFQVIFEPGPRKSIDGYTFTRNYIILNELENVKNKIYILSQKNGKWSRKPMPNLPEFGAINVWAVDSEESDEFWLQIEDFLTPDQLWKGEIGKEERTLIKKLPSFFDADGLTSKQYEATSKDGSKIPYFIVYREDLKLDGSTPTLLYGYGGFEVSLTPGYSSTVGLAWLERGGVYVVANIRGGGEFGPSWHQAALKENRNKAYEDFIAVGEDLIARKITSTPHLGIRGGSNGGLLMGNMLTMRPDLWGAIVCQVPLLDMKRYNKLLAGASWMAEYGDPDIPEQWAYLKQYSPYHNLKKGTKYPEILFTTSTRDDRVHPGHARKMAKKLIDEHQAPVTYYENIEGGHGGSANNEQAAFMNALAYSFLWEKLSK